MKAFKNPLTPEEEKRYISACAAGDLGARSILIESNLRLVAHISRKYLSAVRDAEELISVGTIGLIKAVDTYRPDKGCRLCAYASRCIENELLMLLRQEKKKSREVSMYEPIGTDKEGNEIVIMDVIGSCGMSALDGLILSERLRALPDCMNQVLSERENLIIRLRYGIGGLPPLTQKEVARRLHISRSYVSRIEKKALHLLRNHLGA